MSVIPALDFSLYKVPFLKFSILIQSTQPITTCTMFSTRSLRGPMYVRLTPSNRLNPHANHFSRIPRSSYYETDYRQGKALLRARRPYIVKNAITGACILAFTASICTYIYIPIVIILFFSLFLSSPSPPPFFFSFFFSPFF